MYQHYCGVFCPRSRGANIFVVVMGPDKLTVMVCDSMSFRFGVLTIFWGMLKGVICRVNGGGL